MPKHTLKTTSKLLVLASMIALAACTEETVVESNRGDIIGFVNLVDQNGLKIQNASDVTVSLDADHHVTTNSDGRFEFKNVEAGTYHLLYEKAGYGPAKKFNYIFTAGKVPGVVDLANMVELSKVTILSQTHQISGDKITISGTLEETAYYYLMFKFYDKPDAKPAESVGTTYGVVSCCSPTTTFSTNMTLPTESTLYLGIYAVSKANENQQYTYYDYEQLVYVNPGLKELVAPFKIK